METLRDRLSAALHRGWWQILLRGLAAIAFACLTWFRPGISLLSLVFLFGFYALMDGILAVWTALAGRSETRHWWLLLLGGLLGVAIGIVTFAVPGVTALSLLLYIAVWAIGQGIFTIIAAIRLRRELKNEWLLILSGVASFLFGALLIARPGAGALAVLSLIAGFAFIFGVMLVMLAFRVRTLGNQLAT
ncbi:MAG TPA: HdeD family acid-resistance protein [Candidatus Eisenbacteria bacterium]|jgi:uncharacterized membrane protein HdeD (DUF308 family)|nr:HdeD family acid-resistance protein [Candidatus Eisenbacteria bacterium]